MTTIEQRAYEAIIAMKRTLQEMYEDQPFYWERFNDQCAMTAMQTLIPQYEKKIVCVIDEAMDCEEEVTKEKVDAIIKEQTSACAKRAKEYADALVKQLKGKER